jgi:hypothetical protein
MKKFAPLAALLVAAAGAVAQSDCESHCRAKEGATTELVAHQTQSCEDKTGCESQTGAAVQLVAHQSAGQPASECEGKTACEGEAAVQLVSFPADMPSMHYVVGGKETCCPEEAKQLVAGGDAVQYKVANVTYTDQGEAGKAYAAELDRYLDRMTRVSFVVGDECCCCPIEAEQLAASSGQALKYKVGNTVFDCPEKAIRAAALAYGRAQQVGMTYAINGEATSCSESFAQAKACPTTKASYLVAGRETQCEVEAACMLTTARIEAALAAAEQVSQG